MISTKIFNIITKKLSNQQKLYLTISFKVNKDSKIYFQYNILILSLVINL